MASVRLKFAVLATAALLSNSSSANSEDDCEMRPPSGDLVYSFRLDADNVASKLVAAPNDAGRQFDWDIRATCKQMRRQKNSSAVVGQFKSLLKGILTGEKTKSAWHNYSASEMQTFLVLMAKPCNTAPSLYEKYACIEKNAEAYFSRLRSVKEKLEKEKELSSKMVCDAFKALGVSNAGVQMFGQAARNQYRLPGLSAKDYPAYRECRQENYSCQNPMATPWSENTKSCFFSALRFFGEDSAKYKEQGAINAAGAFALSKILSELRAAARDLSIYSRLCLAGMQARALFDASIPSSSDLAERTRCLADEFQALKEIKDYREWLKTQAGADAPLNVSPDCESEAQAPDQKRLEAAAAQSRNFIKVMQEGKTPTTEAQIKAAIKKALSGRKVDSKTAEKLEKLAMDLAMNEEDPEKYETKLKENVDSSVKPNQSDDYHEKEKPSLDELKKEMDELIAAISIEPPVPQSTPIPTPAPVTPKTTPSSTAGEQATVVDDPLRDYKTLIGAGQKALKEYKKDKSTSFDLSRFLLEGDHYDSDKKSEREHTALARRWKENIDSYRKEISDAKTPAEQVDRLMKSLNRDYLRDYSGDYARLTDLLNGKGGNCEAETKMIASALNALGQELGPPWNFGVQQFDDHMQFVAFNPETKQVWNLLTGEVVAGVVAPVYHPLSLVKGYLDGHSEKTGISDDDLLLAKLDPALKIARPSKSHSTNTKAQYAKTGVNSGMPAPAYAQIATPRAPDLTQREPKKVDSGPVSNALGERRGDPSGKPPTRGDKVLNVFSLVKIQIDREGKLFRRIIAEGERYNYGEGGKPESVGSQRREFAKFEDDGGFIRFKDKRLKEEFLALPSAQEREAYLDRLREQELSDFLDSPKFEELRDVLAHPDRIPEDWNKSGVLSKRFRDFDKIINDKKTPRSAFFNKFQRYKDFADLREKFSKKIASNLGPYLKFLERRDSSPLAISGGLGLFRTMATVDHENRLVEAWEPFLLNPELVSFGPVNGHKPRVKQSQILHKDLVLSQNPQNKKERKHAQESEGLDLGASSPEPVEEQLEQKRLEKREEEEPSLSKEPVAPVQKREGQKSLLTENPLPKAKINLSYETLLSVLVLTACKAGEVAPASPCSMKVFKRWTPDFSAFLLREHWTENEMYIGFPLLMNLAAARGSEKGMYPGPFGEKIDKDVALLFQAHLKTLAASLRIHQSMEGVAKDHGITSKSPYRTLVEYYDALSQELLAHP